MMKTLVGIANYGTKNDPFLHRVIREYRGMDYRIDLVVFSNASKTLGPGVELVVGLPNPNPLSLPFAHKRFFAERADEYDLFIYSEDDILITQHNIEAFLRATQVLPPHEIAGFLRTEVGPDGRRHFADVHSHFHWDPSSVGRRGEYIFAHFSNEHSACYLLTREQLKRAINSGGYLVQPHEGKHYMLETAATDPYTSCGMRKMICISHLNDFLLPHLPNKYIGRLGVEERELDRQVEALLAIDRGERAPSKLLGVETKVQHQQWSKRYFEPCNNGVLSLVPANARKVLSVGCGQGLTEQCLIERGIRVVGLPLDSVIASCAEAKGINLVMGELHTALDQLNGDRFDCILLLDILHLLPDPEATLASFSRLLTPDGRIVVGLPNFTYLPYIWRWVRRDPEFANISSYKDAGLHVTTRRVVRRWLAECRFDTEKIVNVVPERWQRLIRILGRATDVLFGRELIAVGRMVQ